MNRLKALFATWTARGIAIAIVIAVIVIGLQFQSCRQNAQHAAESRLQTGQIGASQASGADAVNTVAAEAQRTSDSEALTRENAKEIRNAPGANDAVNPASRDAGLHALCRRQAYNHTERCRVFNAPAH